jgi:hypothetical protein
LIEGYSQLTAEMIRLAPVYAAAYPLRGRLRRQAWHNRQPIGARPSARGHRGAVRF